MTAFLEMAQGVKANKIVIPSEARDLWTTARAQHLV
jgi:hypothetical protein